MLKRKLITTSFVVAAIIAAALLADFVTNYIVLGTPGAFTPVSTAVIAALVGTPVCFYLISQRFDMQRVREKLSRSLVEKDLAAAEIQLRGQEAELALERLRESESRYRMLTDRATDIIVRYDPQRIIEFASPSIQQLGYEPEALIGQRIENFVHPDDCAARLEAIDRLANDRTSTSKEQGEFRVLRADGDWIWLQGSPAPIHDDAGTLLGMVTVLRDVTARRAIEDELRLKRGEAEAALRVKSDFLANMTHELRTPLNAIVGFSGLLNQSSDLSDRDAHQVELIWDASQTLLRVVNDVLDFSKLEAGAFELDLHAFDPRQIAESTIALLMGQASAKGLALSLSAEGLEGSLLGDGGRLRQVLMNFISNAIKFTPRGDIHVLVRQSADGEGRRLHMAVRDSGIGVPPDQLDAIFGRFTQADASVSRQYGGTGLGLAISKRIIDVLGGEIGLSSKMGEGSTFWFEVTMPIAAPLGHEEAAIKPAAIEQALRLLVVEDNTVNRELICALLQPFDIVIETAADGVEAVEAVSRAQFDLILMDVQMPNMDGLTATRRIRAGAPAGAPRTPIIAMTANVLPDQIARCLDAGMDDHLGKPINPQKLIETLAAWSSPAGDDVPESTSALG